MKLRTHNPKVSSSGIIEENAFSIVASAKAFKILSSSLYKNKILAIIRELACNAYDAHIDNDTSHIPVDIRLPTKLESIFKIRDYGTGLSHDDIMVLYTTYFNSTKTESNDQTGALGLGSKSPFSYTPAFNVTSFFNGMMRTYSAFLDDNGMPKIVMLYETPTSEKPGIEISFPVKDNDHYEFRTNASLALKHFQVNPNMLCGTIIKKAKYDVEYAKDDWQLLYDNNSRNVVQGNVQYPISIESIKNFPEHLNCFRKMSIIFHFPIGTVEFAASREELSYDDYTSKLLIDKFQQIYEYLIDIINTRIEECSTKWEAQVILNEIKNSGYNLSNVLGSKNWQYKKETIEYKGSIDLTELYQVIPFYIFGENKNGWGTTKRRYDSKKIIKISNDSGIVFNDLKSNFAQRIRAYKEDGNYRRVYEFKIGFDYEQETVDNILKSLGYPPYTFTSDIILPPKEKTERLYNVPTFDLNRCSFEADYFEAEEIGKYGTMYYVPLTGRKLSPELDIDLENLETIVECALNLKIINSNDTVYGFQKSVMKIVNLDEHINFIEFMIEKVKSSPMWNELIEYRKLPYDIRIKSNYFTDNIKNIMKHTIVTDPDYIEMLNQYNRYHDFSLDVNLFSFNKLALTLNINLTPLNLSENYIEIVYNNYPLLRRIIDSTSYETEKMFHEFEKYVQNMYEKIV